MNSAIRMAAIASATLALGLSSAALAQEAAPAAAAGAEKQEENDGTDPTKPVGSLKLSFEHIDLDQGISQQQMAAEYTIPASGGVSWRIKVPFSAVSGIGNGDIGLGDVGVKVTKVLKRTNTYGVVVSGEIIADTASRPELGSGKWVFKPNFIYAKFLKGGHIFAPAIVHSQSFAGDSTRGDVSVTTLDFYFVPRLSNPKLFMTIDPAVTHNWKSDEESAALAVTFGYKTGTMFGAKSQVSIKPSIGIGANRPFNWGMQLNYQLLGL